MPAPPGAQPELPECSGTSVLHPGWAKRASVHTDLNSALVSMRSRHFVQVPGHEMAIEDSLAPHPFPLPSPVPTLVIAAYGLLTGSGLHPRKGSSHIYISTGVHTYNPFLLLPSFPPPHLPRAEGYTLCLHGGCRRSKSLKSESGEVAHNGGVCPSHLVEDTRGPGSAHGTSRTGTGRRRWGTVVVVETR